jgi:glycosyltransferase involved in cell wall biosynthesis
VVSISVAMATFDGDRFLAEQLASIASQTRLPAELVVGDDGSTDRTLTILADFATTAPFPVRVTRNPTRLGLNDNFLATASRCNGDVIAWADQDNRWHPRRLEIMAPLFDRPDVAIAFHRARVVDEVGSVVAPAIPRHSRSTVVAPLAMDPWYPSQGFRQLVRTSLVRSVAGLVRPPSRDLDGHPLDYDEWMLFVARAAGSAALRAEALADFRLHPGNFHGPPIRDRRADILDRLPEGHRRYRRTAALYRTWACFWERPSTSERLGTDVSARAAAYHRRLERSASRAAAASDPRSRSTERLRRTVALALQGGYRRRAAGGVGPLGLARDLTWLAVAPALGPAAALGTPVDPVIVERITREREAGRTLQAIASDLERDGVAQPFGIGGWRPSIVQHVIHRQHLREQGAQRPTPPAARP